MPTAHAEALRRQSASVPAVSISSVNGQPRSELGVLSGSTFPTNERFNVLELSTVPTRHTVLYIAECPGRPVSALGVHSESNRCSR